MLHAFLLASLFISVSAHTFPRIPLIILQEYVVVSINNNREAILGKFSGLGPELTSKRQTLVNELEQNHIESRREVLSVIEAHSRKVQYELFWLLNCVIIQNSDIELLEKLSILASVRRIDIYKNQKLKSDVFHLSMGTKTAYNASNASVQWNIVEMMAPKLWNEGINGSGVIVGTLAEGVVTKHKLLRDNYMGDNDFGWYEPGGYNVSRDNTQSGESTARVGLAVATSGYGVAPGAKFMTCSMIPTQDRYLARFLSCAQFLMCPHKITTGERNCSRAPRAIIISGSVDRNVGGLKEFADVLELFDQAGIVVITEGGMASGNPCRKLGTGCKSPSTICAAFTAQGMIRSNLSSCGPNDGNEFKPDLSVPGYGIQSTGRCIAEYPVSCSKIIQLLGQTSGSGQVLGTVALLLQKHPALKPSAVKKILLKATVNVTDDSETCCGGRDNKNSPNYCAGYGYLLASRVIEIANNGAV